MPCTPHRFIKSDVREFGIDDVEDYGPESGRRNLRLLRQDVLLEIIPENASEVNISIIVHSPEKFEEVFNDRVCSACLPGETP